MNDRPDILWLSLESVRADHTPMYGYERNTMPWLNDFAAKSETTVLNNGIAQSLWTPASSASMLTGTYLSTHRVGEDGKARKKLSTNIDTLPELLQNIGYETALFSPNPYISEATGLDRGFGHVSSVKAVPGSYSPFCEDAIDYWLEGVRRVLRSKHINIDRIKHELKTTENEVLERQARRWLKTVSDNSGAFFAYAHVPGPHYPYLPSTDYLQSFTDDISFDAEEAYTLVKDIYYGGSDEIKEEISTGLDRSSEEWAAIEAMYDATLRHMDEIISKIISAAQSAAESLIVIVVGDHGELFGEYGLLGHNLVLHENLIRVPMIVSGLSNIETNEEQMSQQIDLTRTIVERTDTVTDQFEGRDIRSSERTFAVSQRGTAQFEPYLKHSDEFDIERFFKKPYTVVTDGDYKLATNADQTELYKLPDETIDVSDAEEDDRQRLKGYFANLDIDWIHDRLSEGAEFDENQIKQLEDLGYL